MLHSSWRTSLSCSSMAKKIRYNLNKLGKQIVTPEADWFLFIAFTVVVVVGSPTTDLLESVDCLLRDCVRYFTKADRINDRFSYSLRL